MKSFYKKINNSYSFCNKNNNFEKHYFKCNLFKNKYFNSISLHENHFVNKNVNYGHRTHKKIQEEKLNTLENRFNVATLKIYLYHSYVFSLFFFHTAKQTIIKKIIL
ncbi:hypothetical protein EDEG_00477 [Edhazardia aedis USNM 41457]|uniref:Uncharacterized protein n=1 Tax=Edhazardia aedis (strain USNM 41457) TaxID=1003232 RepID=J9D177_EDHAE|nr:hypothetical protein EDEG_00477 [Edhazardia aedis USNM 41457]|eukprot:EJW01334.1 hypothetical protein EDEG_00477 [Edhazardia aedis USNM 41457]